MTAGGTFRATLLGTGTPIPRPDRFGPSTLIEAGEEKILVDAGRGATMQLYRLRVPMGRINPLLLVIGPTGAKELISNLEKAYAADIKIRLVDEKLPPEGIATRVEEFDRDG